MSRFILLTLLAILFVVGSAATLRYFDRFIPTQRRRDRR